MRESNARVPFLTSLYPAMSTKLTKKQKKAAAFRGKKGGGREDPQDVPIMDDPDVDDGFGQKAINAVTERPTTSKEPSVTTPNKKRKREDDSTETNELSSKKAKPSATIEDDADAKEKRQSAPRYILFVGTWILISLEASLTNQKEI